jgi:adenylate cyclase
MKRKLAVILASDVAGYSALVAAREEETVARFSEAASAFRGSVGRHHGRVFNTAGDAILAEFDSAVNAVRCALDIQRRMQAANKGVEEGAELAFRMGIAVGDVMVTGSADLLGEGVNIAARLQAIAEPGGLTISEDVRRLVTNKVALEIEDLGEQDLKNIPHPVRAFAVRPGAQAAGRGAFDWRRPGLARLARSRPLLASLAAAAVLAAIGGPMLSQARKRQQVAATTTPAPAPSNAAFTMRPFDAATVPLVTEVTRRRIAASYPRAGGHKALAISVDGDFYGIAINAPGEDEARKRAHEDCQKQSHRPCVMYAAGNEVIWAKDRIALPLAGELRAQPLEAPFQAEGLRLLSERQRERIAEEEQDAATAGRHRAIALGMRGNRGWGALSVGATRQEAIRRALEICGSRTDGACILYAADGRQMIRPPTTRNVTRVFTVAADPAIEDHLRVQVAERYAAAAWKVVVKGRGGVWGFASEGATEEAAIASAIKNCEAEDRDCKVYAIEGFVVAE